MHVSSSSKKVAGKSTLKSVVESRLPVRMGRTMQDRLSSKARRRIKPKLSKTQLKMLIASEASTIIGRLSCPG